MFKLSIGIKICIGGYCAMNSFKHQWASCSIGWEWGQTGRQVHGTLSWNFSTVDIHSATSHTRAFLHRTTVVCLWSLTSDVSPAPGNAGCYRLKPIVWQKRWRKEGVIHDDMRSSILLIWVLPYFPLNNKCGKCFRSEKQQQK